MYLNAVEIMRRKWEGSMNRTDNVYCKAKGMGWCFKAPFSASYYVDQVWKQIMKYPGYRAYCENLCGGFIDRPSPISSEAFKSYSSDVAPFLYDDKMAQALRSVWPKYGSQKDMAEDFEYLVFADEERHDEILVSL